jgi:hypothetical protein
MPLLELTGYGLAEAIGIYLDSKRAASIVEETFGPGGNGIRARTARRWLNKMGPFMILVKRGFLWMDVGMKMWFSIEITSLYFSERNINNVL